MRRREKLWRTKKADKTKTVKAIRADVKVAKAVRAVRNKTAIVIPKKAASRC